MEFLIPLWKHQREAYERAKEVDEFGLFFEMGAGKTATAINILRAKYEAEGGLQRTLILCPPIVMENWKREFALHSKISQQKIVLLRGSGAKRLETLEEQAWTEDGIAVPKIFVANFESLYMERLFLKIASWRPRFLVVDESHKCKDYKSKRTKLTIQLADNADFRLILSGTPILNSPLDLFSQFRILDQGDTFGKNFFVFRNTYFYDKNAYMPRDRHFPKYEIKPKALEELNERIKPRSMRVTKAECLDLPPLIRKTVYVEMSKEQKRMYEEMRKDFITFIRGQAAVATLAITKALRLQQIVSGFVSCEGTQGSERTVETIKENPRAEALKELLTEITTHSKVIVWAVFKENYAVVQKVCKEASLDLVEVHGDIPASRKQENVDRFNSDPNCRVLLGHPGSGGIGINLTSASYSIFYSRNFSLEQDLQAEARNYRGGSEVHEKITRIDLVTPGTIDELALKRLASKVEIGEKVLREIAAEL